VLTDTVWPLTNAGKFVLRALASSLGIFAFLRLPLIEAHVVLPLTRAQGAWAISLFGTPPLPVEATLACSGADAWALCLGAVLAYPVSWRMRLAGVLAGSLLIISLNTLRIGTLQQVVASPSVFDALHLYVWPAVLTLAIAGYVFGWMRVVDGRATQHERMAPAREAVATTRPRPSRRFVVLTVSLLLLFSAAGPLYLDSARVLALGGFIAQAAALTLGAIGVTAHASGNELWTSRGGFLVTQECISTPLIPVYLAALATYVTSWRGALAGVIATVPLFMVLGVLRLMVVALPLSLDSSLFFVHAFYQLLLGVVLVLIAALWRHGARGAFRPALAGIVIGTLFMLGVGPFYAGAITMAAGTTVADPQGAIALLPAFQIGLYLALWVAAFVAVGWRRFLAGMALLVITQTAGLVLLQTLATQGGLIASVRDIRGWAVAAPILIFAAVVSVARPLR
jgi:exosortase/archaeosortase family protein